MSDDGTLDGSPQCLPRIGFEGTLEFDALVEANPFLFRVYTPKPHSPTMSYDKTIFCLAPNFNAKYASPLDDVRLLSPSGPVAEMATCDQVIRHMDWTTRTSSCYVSCSFSFAWAIWEAMRRYRTGYKHDVEIAVIDAAALKGRAVTGAEVMRRSPSAERLSNFDRWNKISQDTQSVLIYGYIPMESVLSSISLVSLIDKLPSYFLHKSLHDSKSISEHPFERIAWDFSAKKTSFRHFCQDMADRYFDDSTEIRLQGTIVASARLAIAFLRPWFTEWAPKDIEMTVNKTTELACLIAGWPDPEDPAEMTGVIRGLISLVAEEVRSKQSTESVSSGDVLELAGVIDDLEDVVSALEDRLESQETAAKASQAEVHWERVEETTVLDGAARPPATPLRIRIPSLHSRSSSSTLSSPISPMPATPSADQPMPGVYQRKRMPSLTHSLSQYLASSSWPAMHAFPFPSTTAPIGHHPTLLRSSTSTSMASQHIPLELDVDKVIPLPADPSDPTYPRTNIHLTVSYALTGFFLGTLLTLCVASSQRRTVLLHLT